MSSRRARSRTGRQGRPGRRGREPIDGKRLLSSRTAWTGTWHGRKPAGSRCSTVATGARSRGTSSRRAGSAVRRPVTGRSPGRAPGSGRPVVTLQRLMALLTMAGLVSALAGGAEPLKLDAGLRHPETGRLRNGVQPAVAEIGLHLHHPAATGADQVMVVFGT